MHTARAEPTQAVAPAEDEPSPPVAEAKDPGPPEPSACRLRLTEDVAIVRSLPPITGPGECSAPDVVSLEAVVLKDGKRVTIMPHVTLRCEMAEGVIHWMRDDIAPAIGELGGAAQELITADSFDCRGRNRVAGGKLSEHGRANALDVRGFTLVNGKAIDLTDMGVARDFRERVRLSTCSRFTTVLGPGSDGYHEDHVHLDLAARRGGYRMCQWDVRTAPEVANVPLPPEKPREPANDGKL